MNKKHEGLREGHLLKREFKTGLSIKLKITYCLFMMVHFIEVDYMLCSAIKRSKSFRFHFLDKGLKTN